MHEDNKRGPLVIENFKDVNDAIGGFMLDEYISVIDIDLDDDSYVIIIARDTYRKDVVMEKHVYSANYADILRKYVDSQYQEELIKNFSIAELRESLKENRRLELDFEFDKTNGRWGRATFKGSRFDENGIPHNAILAVKDVSEKKTSQLRQQEAIFEAHALAAEAAKAKTNFLARMSHDIRTPMNAIVGLNAIAASHLDDRQRVANCLHKIDLASKHLLTLVNDILDFNRIESGDTSVDEKPIKLEPFSSTIFEDFQRRTAEKKQKIIIDASEVEDGVVLGDENLIRRIANAIVGNAINFTPEGGVIKLTFLEDKIPESSFANYIFICEDTGIGMSPEYLERIFEPFSRSDDARIKNIQGTGLGMSITENLVKQLGGTIKIDSEQNVGTKVTVSIPLEVVQESHQRYSELEGQEVLILSEDIKFLQKINELVTSVGMRSATFIDPDEAARSAAEYRSKGKNYYVVILDTDQRGISHIDAAKLIRRSVGFELPIFLVEDITANENVDEIRAVGITKTLAKPIFLNTLVDALREVDKKRNEIGKNEGNTTGKEAGIFEETLDFSGKNILLVEDNELNAEIAIEIFELTKANIKWSKNGEEAVKEIANSEDGYFDIVFMDIQMPVMNGYEATLAIRELKRNDVVRLPIIALTANAFSSDVQQARNAGMNEHLTKPIEFPRLAEVLKKYLID